MGDLSDGRLLCVGSGSKAMGHEMVEMAVCHLLDISVVSCGGIQIVGDTADAGGTAGRTGVAQSTRRFLVVVVLLLVGHQTRSRMVRPTGRLWGDKVLAIVLATTGMMVQRPT